MVTGGIPKSKSIELIEEETMQQIRDEDVSPVSVAPTPKVPPTPKVEKQFAGKLHSSQMFVFLKYHWSHTYPPYYKKTCLWDLWPDFLFIDFLLLQYITN